MALAAGAVVGLAASGGVSLYCVARLAPSPAGWSWLRRPEVSHALMGVVMAAMLLPPFTATRTPWTVAAACFGLLATVHIAVLARRPAAGTEHFAHVTMLVAMVFMLVTMPPVRGVITGPHAAHMRAAMGRMADAPTALLTTLCVAVLLALGFERVVSAVLLRSSVPAATGTGVRWWLQHPAGLPGCDAVMCAVMAGMLGPML